MAIGDIDRRTILVAASGIPITAAVRGLTYAILREHSAGRDRSR